MNELNITMLGNFRFCWGHFMIPLFQMNLICKINLIVGWCFKNGIYFDCAAGCEAVSVDGEAGFVLPVDAVDLNGVVFEFELVAANGFAESGLNLKIQF